MNVVYMVFLNERVGDEQFPKLKRHFRREIVAVNVDNPHSMVAHMINICSEQGVTYSVGKVK